MRTSIAILVLLTIGLFWVGPHAQPALTVQTVINPQNLAELRQWDDAVDRMVRSRDLLLRHARADTLLAGRHHERLAQYHQGLRVFGGEVTRETLAGVTQSVSGILYAVGNIDTTPRLTSDDALDAARDTTNDDLVSMAPAELVILLSAGSFRLVYQVSAASSSISADFFIDAHSGEIVLTLSNTQTATAVGVGTGVLGDTKKISGNSTSSGFSALDLLRPPSIRTYDMRGNLQRVKAYLLRLVTLTDGELASTSTSNSWTDPAVVDAHVYAGLTYDFYFKRFGRLGLDGNNQPMVSIIHPALRSTAETASDDDFYTFNVGAFWSPNLRAMVYGDGLPANLRLGGQYWNYASGSIDIVAHELTHGVTQFSSGLIYMNESGALNESFSDMMGVSAKFFFHSPGNGPLQANYALGADIIGPGGGKPAGIRSMADPALFGQPDHYSGKVPGCTNRCDSGNDNGGVHVNSGIPNQAFYLAIEGGVNRTSGLAVQGVGASNREQIEVVFYRAFVSKLTQNSTFSLARAATIQAARDQYGVGSAVDRAVTQAWTAVGVN